MIECKRNYNNSLCICQLREALEGGTPGSQPVEIGRPGRGRRKALGRWESARAQRDPHEASAGGDVAASGRSGAEGARNLARAEPGEVRKGPVLRDWTSGRVFGPPWTRRGGGSGETLERGQSLMEGGLHARACRPSLVTKDHEVGY